jgi:heterodisulfide reductase subunit B
MKYALFLGCTIPARAMNYEISTRKMAEKLGIEFIDLLDFSCCGLPMKSVDFMTSIVMGAKNIAVAEEKGLDICVLCNGCAVTLVEANHLLKHDEEMKKKVNKHLSTIGKEFKGTCEVKHLARILYEDVGVEKIREKVKYPLEDFKFAAHYGCHYFKPSVAYLFLLTSSFKRRARLPLSMQPRSRAAEEEFLLFPRILHSNWRNQSSRNCIL